MFQARDLLSGSPSTYPVIQCGTCSLICTAQPASEAPTGYAVGYHQTIAQERRSDSLPRKGAFPGRVRSLQRHKAPGRILDVGCGDGAFLLELRRLGWEVCGTEVVAPLVASLRAQGLDVREGSLPDLELPEAHFDVVCYFGSFEHVGRPFEELAAVKRILKKDGCLLINLVDGSSREARFFGPNWFGFEVPRHRFNYTPAALHLLLTKAGLVLLGADIQQSEFITSFSLACHLGLGSRYAAHRLPLAWLARAIRLLRLFGSGNVLEVVVTNASTP
jgi:SAM-dependent methyltransferase